MTKRPSLASSMRTLAEPTAPDPVALVASRKAAVEAVPSQKAKAGPRYEGMKKMLIPVDPDTHRRLRMLALQQGVTLEKLMQDAAADYVRRHAG